MKLTSLLQGKLVPKLTLGPFLTLSFRNGANLQNYPFQAHLNPCQVEQNFAIQLLETAKNKG